MNLIEQVKDALVQPRPQERASKLEQLSDNFEYAQDLKEEEIVESVTQLLVVALQEKDPEAKESFFHAMNAAVVHHQKEKIGERVDWDILVAALPGLEKPYLDYAFNMLSLSRRERYLSVLSSYTRSEDAEISELARDAMDDLQYTLAHPSASQGEEPSVPDQ
ncbi:hypothetical protein [Dictyobacter aurantiacus]|uniref:Immunity protein 30 domain-containing protein n=1 Tax=Dictyobacter aurantiacus TaxID=1936993 RepID=A0A401Z8C9_9CHLR|nr:hypothetical protein [Dictyobacter aurantiacus]GCE03093.1 hypothetical protein KDAU_04220 [Dictyobacter aurantiacus]